MKKITPLLALSLLVSSNAFPSVVLATTNEKVASVTSTKETSLLKPTSLTQAQSTTSTYDGGTYTEYFGYQKYSNYSYGPDLNLGKPIQPRWSFSTTPLSLLLFLQLQLQIKGNSH